MRSSRRLASPLFLFAPLAPLALALAGASCGGDLEPVKTAPQEPLAVGDVTGPAIAYLGEEACFEVKHNGGASALVSWNWGDSMVDAPAPGATSACHTFAKAGRRLVAASVAAVGQKLSSSRGLIVVPKPAEERPTASSTIAYDEARDRVWVVNPDAGSVAVLAADPPALIKEIPLCADPRTLSILGEVVAVACQGDGSVRLLNAADPEAPAASVDLGAGSAPFGVTADPRGSHFFVSLQGAGEIAVIEVASAKVIARLDVGPDPRGLAMISDGLLLVTRFRASEAGATVTVVDATVPSAPLVFAPLLLPPDTGLNSDTNNDGVPSFLNQVVPSPDGGRVVIPSLRANNVTGLFKTGEPLSSQTTARALLTELTLSGPKALPEETARGRYAFDDLDYASSSVFSPEGSLIYTAIQGAERVEVRDAFTYDVAGSIDGVGHAPEGLAISPDGKTLFVQAFLSRMVRVYDVTNLSSPPKSLADISTVAVEPLSAQVLEGKRIFYRSRDPRMSRTSYLSCASCHMDGEGDNLVWDFTDRGEGLRNTIPLVGRAGTLHGPMHWSSNFDEVQDFEHDIRGPMGGEGFLPDDAFHDGTVDTTLGDPKAGLSAELDALAAYVASLDKMGLSPLRKESDTAWKGLRDQGRQIFVSAETGCATCHFGARFTDSAFVNGQPLLHDVGTLGAGSGKRLGGALPGIDTPTLRGLWKSAPYLHDGSASSLRQVLRDRNPADKHGTTSQLSDADLDALEVYLLSIDDLEP